MSLYNLASWLGLLCLTNTKDIKRTWKINKVTVPHSSDENRKHLPIQYHNVDNGLMLTDCSFFYSSTSLFVCSVCWTVLVYSITNQCPKTRIHNEAPQYCFLSKEAFPNQWPSWCLFVVQLNSQTPSVKR